MNHQALADDKLPDDNGEKSNNKLVGNTSLSPQSGQPQYPLSQSNHLHTMCAQVGGDGVTLPTAAEDTMLMTDRKKGSDDENEDADGSNQSEDLLLCNKIEDRNDEKRDAQSASYRNMPPRSKRKPIFYKSSNESPPHKASFPSSKDPIRRDTKRRRLAKSPPASEINGSMCDTQQGDTCAGKPTAQGRGSGWRGRGGRRGGVAVPFVGDTIDQPTKISGGTTTGSSISSQNEGKFKAHNAVARSHYDENGGGGTNGRIDRFDNLSASPASLSTVLLELVLKKRATIERYFDLVEEMFFLKPKCMCGYDELIYEWIMSRNSNKCQTYAEMYPTDESRKRRMNMLNSIPDKMRKEHSISAERLARFGYFDSEPVAHVNVNQQIDGFISNVPITGRKVEGGGMMEEILKTEKGMHSEGGMKEFEEDLSKNSSVVDSSKCYLSCEPAEPIQGGGDNRVHHSYLDAWIANDFDRCLNSPTTTANSHHGETYQNISLSKATLFPSVRAVSQLDFFISPIVRFEGITQWSPREVAVFEVALCYYGQMFDKIANKVKTKSCGEVYRFYAEIFKQTNRYVTFKEYKKQADWYTLSS